MKTIISWVINNLTKTAIIAGIVGLLVTQVGTCNNSKKLYQKMGELKASVEIHNTVISNLEKDNTAILTTNKEIVKAVQELKSQSIETNKELAANKKTINELKNTRPDYAEECKPIVAHMQLEIDTISKSFDLAIFDRDTWMQVAHNNELGWKNETQVRINLEEINKLIISDSRLKDDIIKNLNRQVAINKLKVNIIGGGMVVALISVVIFGMIK